MSATSLSSSLALFLFLLVGSPWALCETRGLTDEADIEDVDSTKAPASRVTLISKSSGLQNPDMEEGNTELELGDVNGDGNLDIVSVGDHGSPYVNSGEHGIMVWLGNGAGSWSVRQFGNFGYGGCALGDLDLDGYCDVAWGIHHNWNSSGMGSQLMGAARGDGTGATWTNWGSGLASNGETWGMFATALADFDCDGLLDVISQSFGGSNGLRLYKNNGDGTWTQVWALTGGSVGSTLETCDVNADGYLDIVSTRSGTNVLLGDGAFGFTTAIGGLPSGTIRGIDTADMNHDGTDDLVFAFGSSGIRCYEFHKASGTWRSVSNGLPATVTCYLTQFGDFDGDGNRDIVAYSDPTGRVFMGDGTGNWTADAMWTMPSPGNASALRVDGDIDHDGREDIAVLATKSGFPFYRNQLRIYSPWQQPQDPAVTVTSPDGGETLRQGGIRDIRWLAAIPAAYGPATVKIQLSYNGAAGPWTTIASNLPDNGRYQWLVDGFDSEHCRIKIVATTASGSAFDISDEDFTLRSDKIPLEADAMTLSESAGGTINLRLYGSASNAHRKYIMLGTVSGTAPGFPMPGGMVTLPLNWDVFTDVVILLLNTPVFSNFLGLLDAAGESSAQINSGPLPSGNVGVVMHYAYALNNPFNFVSNPIQVEIVP